MLFGEINRENELRLEYEVFTESESEIIALDAPCVPGETTELTIKY